LNPLAIWGALVLGLAARGTGPAGIEVGLDRLFTVHAGWVRGKRVGIITNRTAVDGRGRHIVDVFLEHEEVSLVCLFAPEHGIEGKVPDGHRVSDTVYHGVPVYSLYGRALEPQSEVLAGLDVIVYDIQDVGARFYTYITTLGLGLKAAAGSGLIFIVLDRPDPLGGVILEGPVLDPRFKSFVGVYPVPVRYGMTPGELARMIVGEGWLDLEGEPDLRVVELSGWRRDMYFDETGLEWIPPSPNMGSVETAMVYPGTCFLEGTNVSEGRGTGSPFLLLGAPWLDGKKLAWYLNAKSVPGIEFQEAEFTPRSIPGVVRQPKYENRLCSGIRLRVVDRRSFSPVRCGVEIISAIRRLYPGKLRFRAGFFDRLAGTDSLRLAIEAGKDPESIARGWEKALADFNRRRGKYLLY